MALLATTSISKDTQHPEFTLARFLKDASTKTILITSAAKLAEKEKGFPVTRTHD
jgi:hypothetical protein